MRFRSALAAFALLAGTAAPAWAEDLLIRHANVVDVAHGRVIPNQAISVRGDTIRAVGPDRTISRRYRTSRQVDASGRFVMPGLWDMHVHFGGGQELIEENKDLLPLYVA